MNTRANIEIRVDELKFIKLEKRGFAFMNTNKSFFDLLEREEHLLFKYNNIIPCNTVIIKT